MLNVQGSLEVLLYEIVLTLPLSLSIFLGMAQILNMRLDLFFNSLVEFDLIKLILNNLRPSRFFLQRKKKVQLYLVFSGLILVQRSVH